VSELDPRSLIFVVSLLGLLCLVILTMLRRSFPPSIGGLQYWSWGLFCMVLSSFLAGLTGFISAFFSVIVSNAMLAGGIMAFYAGFRDFAGVPPQHRLMGVALAMLTAGVAWFTYVDSDYHARSLLVMLAHAALFFTCARLVDRTTGDTMAGRFTCIVFATICIIAVVRAGLISVGFEVPTNVLAPTLTQKIYLASLSFSILASTLGAMMLANERLRTELEFIASHDQLTDAYSRRAFIESLEKELARSARSGRPLAVLMCDLDNFKSINDRFGHAVGDRVIIDFVQRATELLRNIDSIGRYGGEEFVVLLPETSLSAAKGVAERLCSAIAEPPSLGLPPYTLSIGVAAAEDVTPEVDELLSDADRALYAAKANGRNRVELAQSIQRKNESRVASV
jgi:diguanylate cyclase (GGDEF)-like protein